VAIALVAFADTSVLSRIYSTKTRTFVDPNQEMIGLGASSASAGLFGGFPVGSSSVRTAIAHATGSRTQLTSVVGALMITLLLVFAPRMLEDLPHAALAAVVIASAFALFELGDLGRLWRVQRWEFVLSLAAFLGVALLDAVRGIMIAVGIALAEFIWNAWRPHFAILGRPEEVQGYHDLERYPEAKQIPGLVLFRWDAPLFFANAERFREVVLDAVASAPSPVRWLVVSAEPVTNIDVTSFDMLRELYDELESAGVRLVFAEMKDPVMDKLRRFAVAGKVGEESFFHTIDEAVEAYLKVPSPESLRATPSRRPNS
jgi:MFS superfamily sulfate permease-like transporter